MRLIVGIGRYEAGQRVFWYARSCQFYVDSDRVLCVIQVQRRDAKR
jgi:hypothetical protein